MTPTPQREPLLKLSASERKRLTQLAASHCDGRVVRRAQALLWLAQGELVSHVAQRLHVSRQMLYDTLERYRDRAARPLLERLQDQARSGRRASARTLATQVVQELLPQPPAALGYRAQQWTVGMLQAQLLQQHGRLVSEDTLRRALHETGYRYKRPRYSLARREPHWRQVKGGSSAASKDAVAPCC